MATNNFDNLNNIVTTKNEVKPRAIPYEEYFEPMEITDEQKEQRIAFANDFDDKLFFVLMMIAAGIKANNDIDTEIYYEMLSSRLADTVYSMTDDLLLDDGYIAEYILQRSKQIVDTTILNIADAYYHSMDRAMFISENEANAVMNYHDEIKAIRNGYKFKTWITMKDKKVRHSHNRVDGETIGIFQVFKVGGSEMMFPHDESLGASANQLINCRCSVRYSK